MTIRISKEDLEEMLEINRKNYDEDDPVIFSYGGGYNRRR